MPTENAHQRYLAELPNSWSICDLRALGSIVGGSTPSRAISRFWNGNIPWVTPGEMTALVGTKFLNDTRERITRAGYESCGTRLLPPGSLLITTRATLGLVALAGCEVSTNQGFKSVVFCRDNYPDFYFHLFHRLKPEMERLASGTTFLEISAGDFGRITIPVPPPSEQRAIAAVLDSLDDAIQKTEQIIAKLQQVKQGLLHDLLTRGIDDNGELRDPERHPEQFQDSPLGRIPRGWEVLPIGSVGEVRLGKQKTPDARPSPWTRPYLRVVNIFDDRLDLRDVNEMNFSPSEFNRYALRYGDVLLTEGDLASAHNVGRTAVFRDEIPHCCFQNSLLRFRVGEDDLPDFFHYAFSHLRVCGRFARATMSTTVFHLSAGRLSPLPIMRPPLEEQRLIAERLLLVDKHLHVERSSQDKQLALVRALSDDLLTGRVRTTSLPEFSA